MEQEFYEQPQTTTPLPPPLPEPPAYMPPFWKSKKFLIGFLLLIILMGMGTVSYIFLTSQKTNSTLSLTPTVTPEVTNTPTPTILIIPTLSASPSAPTSWKTYTDTIYTIEYPANWESTSTNNAYKSHYFSNLATVKQIPNNGSGYTSLPTEFLTVTQMTSTQTPKEYADSYMRGAELSGVDESPKEITLNGLSAVTFQEQGEGASGFDIVVSNGKTLITLTIPDAYPPSNPTITHMLNSFSLTK